MSDTNKTNSSISISVPYPEQADGWQKLALVGVGLGFLMLLVAAFGAKSVAPQVYLWSSLGLLAVSVFVYAYRQSWTKPAGVDNHGVWKTSLLSRGVWGWILGIVMTGFYILIYWYPATLEYLIQACEPMSQALRNKPADNWFLYGIFYTFAILLMGGRVMFKYRHSAYQLVRTASVMFFQLGFAFLIPGLLQLFNQPEFYFHYFWPLEQSYLFPSTVSDLTARAGGVGIFMVSWGAIMTFIATPILTYFYGKRWYCSWVCGCGGLANTLGDEFRQLSDKSLRAWQVERWMVHGVLVFITLTTALLWINAYFEGGLMGTWSQTFAQWYGFYIGAVFSGVIGVGFYPIMGSRVWCRFGCPMAAILGLIQKYYSRFRITTNGGQCISCGNCSVYCEMGIDVKWYAQRGQNVIRASCVGCGICSTVCPRGVLNLENGPQKGRFNKPILLDKDKVDVVDTSLPKVEK